MADNGWQGDRGPSFWLGQDDYLPAQSLSGPVRADVAVVGGGFTGLWTAIELKERDPRLKVCLLEQEVVGYGASGRNGGFCEPSLTHGYANGVRHFPEEIEELERLGRDNFNGLLEFVARHRISCDLERSGVLEVATTPWQVEELRGELLERSPGRPELELLEGDAARSRLNSPQVLAALYDPVPALLNPARLARGLRRVAEELGVRVWERTPVRQLRPIAGGVEAVTPQGVATAQRAVLATNAYSGQLLPRLRTRFVPVYDYVLVSEPLNREQRKRIGWEGREGASEHSNHFHYFRLTADDRILWGGYDAIYHFGGSVGPQFDHRPKTYTRLLEQFRKMFPSLGDLAFTHRWGGAIASTTRFTCTFGSALGGRVVYALGYTGLGVAATRFAGGVLAARLLEPASPLLRLRLVRQPPFPFPPEPLRWPTLAAVQGAMSAADRTGRRGLLLGALDRLGIGFDS
jgi:glycine/D-amino acid oxidase-like deaminating enzyme